MNNRVKEHQYIIYACPVGELNSQIELYLAKSRELYGENKAHGYMPHCTLTGFFSDAPDSVPDYLDALERAYEEAIGQNTSLDIKIERLVFNKDWHGIELQADGIKQSIVNFTRQENSATRKESLRLKDWLHLSLAYGFDAEHGKQLKQLAQQIIDLQSNVSWELRFYQKNLDGTWHCWQSLPILTRSNLK